MTFQPWVQMFHAMAHWKASVLLHNQQKFHKIPPKNYNHSSLSIPPKSHFGLQRSLGVNKYIDASTLIVGEAS